MKSLILSLFMVGILGVGCATKGAGCKCCSEKSECGSKCSSKCSSKCGSGCKSENPKPAKKAK